jgi:flagellar hook protein FlgE
VSNNIANVNTVGYKASHAQYSDTFSNMLRPMVPNEKGDAAKIAPTQVGGGVQVQAVAPTFSQGTIQVTSSNSDLAIAGNGFFMVRNPQTQQFFVTRAGNFRVDASGALVTQLGYRVQGSLNASTKVIYDSTTGSYNVLGPQDNYQVVVNAGTDPDTITGLSSTAAGTKVLTVPANVLSRLSTGMPIGVGSSKFREGTIITEIDPKSGRITLSDSVLAKIEAGDSTATPPVIGDVLTVGKKSVDAQSYSLTLPCDYLRPEIVKGMPLIGTGIKPGTVIADPGSTGNVKVTISASPGLVIQDPIGGITIKTSPTAVAADGAELFVRTKDGLSAGMVISNPGGPYNNLVVQSTGTDSVTGKDFIKVVKQKDDGTLDTFTFPSTPPDVASISISGAKTIDKKKNYVLVPTVAGIEPGDPVTGDGIPPGTKIGVPTTDPVTGFQRIPLLDSKGDAVYPTMDSYGAVRLAFKDQFVTISDFPMTDSFKNVALSLGNSYRPAATVGDVRISFNEYDQMEADPTRVPDYTFVGTDGKPLDGITLQAARANSPKIRTFNVGATGDINIVLSNGQTFTSGAVLLQMFKDPGALTRQGDNLFSGMATAGPYNGPFAASNISGLTPSTGGLGVINGGSLELSNVDLGEEFSSMIITQRAFQAGSRLISTADQMLEEAVNLKR